MGYWPKYEKCEFDEVPESFRERVGTWWFEMRWFVRYRMAYRLRSVPRRTLRAFKQVWWRRFGERCPCGATWRPVGYGEKWSLCCAHVVIAAAIDEAWDQGLA